MTATPDKRTLGFFNQNIVSEYSREQAIIDGVNVGEDIFLIETSIAKEGATILKQLVEYRNRLTRAKRWKNLEDDFTYKANQLDRAVINPSQIRTVIQAFKDSLFTKLFPRRKEVPKTLIFAKTDSHADDIIQIVRDVFGEGNEFCQKITCKADNPEAILSSFRNDYYPRIAVTVDMIATGVDVKPIECLLFMRDVRSKNYFEQMKGRGTRTLSKEDLQKVTPSALENKDRFIIVDAVGVTQSEKTETRCLERKPSLKLVDLMNSVAMGAKDEDTLTTLANRIIRLNAVMTNDERKDFQKTIGLPATSLAQNMLDAFDEDVIKNKSNEILIDSDNNGSQNRHCEPLEEAWQSINNENTAKQSFADGTAEEKSLFKEAQQELIENAVTPFYKPENREFIENIKKSHEQIIDNVNIDTVIFADYGEVKKENAEKMIQTFKEFINENIDEITALGIVYNEKYKNRFITLEGLNKLYEKLKSKKIWIERLGECYSVVKPEKIKKGSISQIADLISLIRFELGLTEYIRPFAEQVNKNFKEWVFKLNQGKEILSTEQMDWLRKIKDHIITSFSIKAEDLDLSPFDHDGGLGRFYEVFGERYEQILAEMNEKLVA